MDHPQKTEAEALLQNIQGLRESINLDWQDLDRLALTDRERETIRLHIKLCTEDLAAVMHRLEELDAHRT